MKKPGMLNEMENMGDEIQYLELLLKGLKRENVRLRHQLKELKIQQANLIILDPRITIKM
jgi:hypothetical protein